MENPIIFELNRNNAFQQDPNYNSVWDAHVQEPLVVNEGDVLSLKMAMIDVEENSSDYIVIDAEGETLTFQYGYYEYNTDMTDKTPEVSGPANPDYKMYVAYDSSKNYGKIESLTFDLDPEVSPLGFWAYLTCTYQTSDGQTHVIPENQPLAFQFPGGGVPG